MSSSQLSGPSYYIGMATSTAPIYFGSNFLIREKVSSFVSGYGFPTVKLAADNLAFHTVWAICGWRTIALGLAGWTFVLLRDRRSLGIIQACLALMIMMDGFEVWGAGATSQEVMSHLTPAAGIATVALSTLFWGPAAPFKI